MKIEKISESQIRCTLNKQDLTDRELHLSELAYGSDKAKALFSELMLQASYECGFEADNVPLMIEAIPISQDCLVLLVTKVADPDELDSRYSRMSAAPEDMIEDDEPVPNTSLANEILECFEGLRQLLAKKEELIADKRSKTGADSVVPKQKKNDMDISISKSFSFASLSEVIDLAKIISPYYHGKNTLYKNPDDERYCLVLNISRHTAEEFNKVCNVCSEYGSAMHTRYASISYFDEHFKVLIKGNAIQKLTLLNKR